MILHYEVSMTFFLPCVVLFYFLFYYCNYSYENALIRQQCFHDIVQRLVSNLRCCSQFSIPIIPLRASSFVIDQWTPWRWPTINWTRAAISLTPMTSTGSRLSSSRIPLMTTTKKMSEISPFSLVDVPLIWLVRLFFC